MKDNFKLAICTFHTGVTPHDIGGVSFVPIYLKESLSEYIKQIDIISFRKSPTKEDYTSLWNGVISTTDVSILSQYDYVIFCSMGLTYEKPDHIRLEFYKSILRSLKCNYAFIVNEENDRKIYPYYEYFLHHDNLDRIYFNSYSTYKVFEDFLEICPNHSVIQSCPPLASLETILEKSRHKKNKIISTARWTTSKRIFEYISMIEDFRSRGIEVATAGAHQSYWYSLQMKPLLDKYTWEDHDVYEPSQLPDILKDVRYHWNFLYQARGMGKRTHNPRIELATMEAFNEGCLPVICRQFVPDYVTEDSAIVLPKERLQDIPEVLSGLSQSDIEGRLSNFYTIMKENVHDTYEQLSEEILAHK